VTIPTVRLGEVADVNWGDTSVTKSSYVERGYTAYSATGPDGFLPYADYDREAIILSAIGARCGKTWFADGKWSCIKNTIRFWSTDGRLDNRYLYWTTNNEDFFPKRGAAQPFITIGDARKVKIPLPPLDEQRRIATILDKADALRCRRKRALGLLDGLAYSIFLEMFGDPAVNSRKYRLKTFGEISEKMSDGPFGSNLKSAHYVGSGVRVIRLQNIGAGKFIDDDKAYISEDHFKALAKHECLPGDVLVGTLGDPNLRACLQPKWLPVAINKADCVQIRPNRDGALPEYVVALMNQPAVERLAQGLMLGQTRTRISMGRLRELSVPIAPIEEQARFVAVLEKFSSVAKTAQNSCKRIESALSALQHRAFSGELE